MYIIDPNTLNKVDIFSKNGKHLLKQYIIQYQKGGEYTQYLSNDINNKPVSELINANVESIEEYIKREFNINNTEEVDLLESSQLLGGTMAYISPEYVWKNNVNDYSKIDIWSLGIVFLEMFTTFNFYIILYEINKRKNENIEEIIKFAKNKKKISFRQHTLPVFLTKDNINKSYKYIEYIKNEYKEHLSKQNINKLDDIFELIKKMLIFEPRDRIQTDILVKELKQINKVSNTYDITIPFNEEEYREKVKKSTIHSKNEDNLKKLSKIIKQGPRPHKIGIYNIENDKIFDIEDKQRDSCNIKNSCIISKKERVNMNELLIHRYLSSKDTNHNYIIDFYTYVPYKDQTYIYMEYSPNNLKQYIKDNYQSNELKDYYIKNNKNVRKNQIKPEISIYKKYINSKGGVELGEENCNVQNPCKFTETSEKRTIGQIKCKVSGQKRKCKTHNKQFAEKVFIENYNHMFEDRCAIMLKLAEAIQFINNNNILHSDIKPENIVLEKTKVDGINKYRVKLIDFGISVIHYNNKIYTLKKNILLSYDTVSDSDSDTYGQLSKVDTNLKPDFVNNTDTTDWQTFNIDNNTDNNDQDIYM